MMRKKGQWRLNGGRQQRATPRQPTGKQVDGESPRSNLLVFVAPMASLGNCRQPSRSPSSTEFGG